MSIFGVLTIFSLAIPSYYNIAFAKSHTLPSSNFSTILLDGTSINVNSNWLKVPALHSIKSQKFFYISYLILNATYTPTNGRPFLYLAGGPGDSSTKLLTNWKTAPTFTTALKHGPVILIDQRMTGRSVPQPNCSDLSIHLGLKPSPGVNKRAQVLRSVAETCKKELQFQGYLPEMMSTIENANDIADLIKELNIGTVTLFGQSYGTHLALTLLNQFPDLINRVVLHGVEGPDHTFKTIKQIKNWMQTLENESGYPVYEIFVKAMKILAKKPNVTLNGLTRVGAGSVIELEPVDLLVYLFHMTGSTKSVTAVPDVLNDISSGNLLSFAQRSAELRIVGANHPYGLLSDCLSGASTLRRLEIKLEINDSLWMWSPASNYLEICKGFGVDQLPNSFRNMNITSKPVLLVSGLLDGKTPVQNAIDLLPYLTNSESIVVPNSGHSWSDAYTKSIVLRKRFDEFLAAE